MMGWREWLALPELGIEQVKCKVDTGARTSALHAFEIEPDSAAKLVRFKVAPLQHRADVVVACEAAIVDQRTITDSGAHREKRIVISSMAVMGEQQWPIEITLTNRKDMRFRMLLGRSGISRQFTVDPARSYMIGKRRR